MHFSSVTFCFAHLGAFIGCSSGPYPSVKDFALGDSGLSLALGELYPLLSESLSWFESMREVLRREKMSSETNTAISKPSSSRLSIPASPRPFHALQEECSLNEDTFFRFRDRFQFPKEIRAHLPKRGEKFYAFAHEEVYFYEAAFLCGLRFPIHPFIMELLHHLNIALGQLMPNSWRIVMSCMVIWTIIADGDMITLNKLVHLYHLKKSKEFGYYELVPWDRRSKLIANLPSSFRYWKSRYFFVSGEGWETLFDNF